MSSGWVEREVGRGRVHTLMWTRGASNGRRLQRVRRRLRLVREGGNLVEIPISPRARQCHPSMPWGPRALTYLLTYLG